MPTSGALASPSSRRSCSTMARSCNLSGALSSPSWTSGSKASACIRPAISSATRSAFRRDMNSLLGAEQMHSTGADMSIAALIDLDRYPVHDLASPRTRELIADCQAQLALSGYCVLEGFLSAHAIAAASQEGRMLAPLAHRTPNSRSTVYLEAPDESYAESHPKRRLQRTSVGAVAYDLFPRDSLIRRL